MQIAKNLLAATDFSVLGRGVVDHALELAELFDGKLSVVSVYTPVGGVPPVNRETDELRREMAELEKRLEPSGRINRAFIQFGDPAETIVRVAQEIHADLIVMGTNSRHGFNRWTSSSVAFEVMRHAPVPLLVIKKAALRARETADSAADR
ncbi:MAG: universal stress protein [Myxococcales bacterium]